MKLSFPPKVARNNEGKHHRRLRDVLFEYLARFVYKSSLASVEDIFRLAYGLEHSILTTNENLA